MLPEIDRQPAGGVEVAFRGDAAFAKPELYDYRGARSSTRFAFPPTTTCSAGTRLLIRLVGRPSYKPVVPLQELSLPGPSLTKVRRVVAKVEFHFGELFPRVGFIVTNFQTSNRAVVRFYNRRATAEQWIKEGKQAVAMTRLSCNRFRANEVRCG